MNDLLLALASEFSSTFIVVSKMNLFADCFDIQNAWRTRSMNRKFYCAIQIHS